MNIFSRELNEELKQSLLQDLKKDPYKLAPLLQAGNMREIRKRLEYANMTLALTSLEVVLEQTALPDLTIIGQVFNYLEHNFPEVKKERTLYNIHPLETHYASLVEFRRFKSSAFTNALNHHENWKTDDIFAAVNLCLQHNIKGSLSKIFEASIHIINVCNITAICDYFSASEENLNEVIQSVVTYTQDDQVLDKLHEKYPAQVSDACLMQSKHGILNFAQNFSSSISQVLKDKKSIEKLLWLEAHDFGHERHAYDGLLQSLKEFSYEDFVVYLEAIANKGKALEYINKCMEEFQALPSISSTNLLDEVTLLMKSPNASRVLREETAQGINLHRKLTIFLEKYQLDSILNNSPELSHKRPKL